MRRTSHVPQAAETQRVNLTPLIDMVFILLIFFIVTSSFVKETGVEVQRPTADTAQRKEDAGLLIGVDEHGRVWIDGRDVDPRRVRAAIERLKAESPSTAAVIVADERATVGIAVRVMDQVRLAGIDDVSIAASRPLE